MDDMTGAVAAMGPQDKTVWQMHVGGMAPSQIAGELGCTEDEAREAVARCWACDRNANKRRRVR